MGGNLRLAGQIDGHEPQLLEPQPESTDDGKGRTAKKAIALAEEAVKLGQAATPKVDTAATEKLIAQWKAK